MFRLSELYRFLMACLATFWWPFAYSAIDLPVLANPATVSGAPTMAQFYAGARANGASEFVTQFRSQDLISLHGAIEVEPGHIGQLGNLYIVVDLEGQYFMRDGGGIYQVWDADLLSLVPTTTAKSLQAIESLTLLDNFEVGSLGLSGKQFSVYLAYELISAPGELFYSGSPLTIEILSYNPAAITAGTLETLDTVFTDRNRNREIPLLVFLPAQETPRPLILFSHGLGGNRFTATYLGRHWAARGYVVVFMQHAGSDSEILEGVPLWRVVQVLNQAASAANSIARIEDVSAVIDQLEVWQQDTAHPLYRRIDLSRIGMSGHSFGARTTQSVSGEDIQWIQEDTRDYRIDAAMPLSGSSPDADNSIEIFKGVDLPWLHMTGTRDVSPIGLTTVEDRLAVFPALPPGGKYELVLFDGEHHAFTDHELLAGQTPRNPAHHGEIAALATAFWDAWLAGFPDARSWLDGAGAESVLQPLDSWQFK